MKNKTIQIAFVLLVVVLITGSYFVIDLQNTARKEGYNYGFKFGQSTCTNTTILEPQPYEVILYKDKWGYDYGYDKGENDRYWRCSDYYEWGNRSDTINPLSKITGIPRKFSDLEQADIYRLALPENTGGNCNALANKMDELIKFNDNPYQNCQLRSGSVSSYIWKDGKVVGKNSGWHTYLVCDEIYNGVMKRKIVIDPGVSIAAIQQGGTVIFRGEEAKELYQVE